MDNRTDMFEHYPKDDIETLQISAVKNVNNANLEERVVNAMESPIPDVSELKSVISLLLTEKSFFINQFRTYDRMIEPVLNRIEDNKRKLSKDDVNNILMAFHARVNSDVMYQKKMQKLI